MNAKLEATKTGSLVGKFRIKPVFIGHKFQFSNIFRDFRREKKLWMTYVCSPMATLFSPTKHIMQEGDLVIIWIVCLSPNLPAYSVEPQYSPTNNA